MTKLTAIRIAAPLFALTLGFAGCGSDDSGSSSLPVEEVVDGKADGAHAAKFETFTGKDGKSYFHLLAANGQKVLQSQGYTSKQSAEDGITSVRVNGVDTAGYETLQAQTGEYYFNLKAANGKIIGTSELYVSRSNADRALSTVVSVVEAASEGVALKSAKFQVFHGIDGQYYFHLRASNGEIVLQSEGYARSASATNGIGSVKVNGVDSHKYQVHDAANGQAYFTLVAANNQVIAISETYTSRTKASAAAKNVASLLAGGTF
jgi:uncharacterized protein YegP (UPF0339 family)